MSFLKTNARNNFPHNIHIYQKYTHTDDCWTFSLEKGSKYEWCHKVC